MAVAQRQQSSLTLMPAAVPQDRGVQPQRGPLRSTCGGRPLELLQVGAREHRRVGASSLVRVPVGWVQIPFDRSSTFERLCASLKLRKSRGQRASFPASKLLWWGLVWHHQARVGMPPSHQGTQSRCYGSRARRGVNTASIWVTAITHCRPCAGNA